MPAAACCRCHRSRCRRREACCEARHRVEIVVVGVRVPSALLLSPTPSPPAVRDLSRPSSICDQAPFTLLRRRCLGTTGLNEGCCHAVAPTFLALRPQQVARQPARRRRRPQMTVTATLHEHGHDHMVARAAITLSHEKKNDFLLQLSLRSTSSPDEQSFQHAHTARQ